MIESGYTNKARSSANAVGMWQFMKGTGVRYGLTVDSAVDERRDPEKATHAAAKYLLDLYKQFGSWYLAAASYNCGENRVQKEINRNADMKNFWELSNNYCLPNETKNYVPQMIAATIIAKNPEKYGFKNIPYQQPLKYETIKMTESTSLQAAAVAATTNYEEISGLNPELLRDATPGGAYLLKIPPGKKEAFNKNIMMARAQFPAWGGRMYAAREDSGDSESYVAPRRSSRSYWGLCQCPDLCGPGGDLLEPEQRNGREQTQGQSRTTGSGGQNLRRSAQSQQRQTSQAAGIRSFGVQEPQEGKGQRQGNHGGLPGAALPEGNLPDRKPGSRPSERQEREGRGPGNGQHAAGVRHGQENQERNDHDRPEAHQRQRQLQEQKEKER